MPDRPRRQLLMTLPALGLAKRVFAQTAAIRARSLNQFGIAVSDPKRSRDFYQGLFGMSVEGRREDQTILRVGAGPQLISIGPISEGASPRITHYCLGLEEFNADGLLAALARNGVARSDSIGPMKAIVATRDSGRLDLLFGDPDGIECQLQDVGYCGGTGPLGNVCLASEPSPKKGLIALKDIRPLTIFSNDAVRSNKFYQDLFGFSIRSYQGPTAPTLAVGPTVQFLMFTGGGARGGSPPRPATINHACMNLDGFKSDDVATSLERFGLKPRESMQGPARPMRHYISMRMENRGGAKEGTPEPYFTDPDGILMQLQDTNYCGDSGFLGDACPK